MRYTAVAMSEAAAAELAKSSDVMHWIEAMNSGIDLDKAWFAIQVLLTGGFEDSEPILTGEPLGADHGYGPAVYASPADVVRVAGTFSDFSPSVLTERFDVAVLEELGAYPGVWDEDPDQLAEWIVGAAMTLVELYRSAATDGLGILAQIG